MLECRTEASVRKALASKALAAASGTRRFAYRLMIFASPEIFSFSRGAKFGEFRPTAPAQLV
jgi:hypothetical protein